MDRLKKINTILFTIMASILILISIILGIVLIVEAWPRTYSRPDTGMISNEEVNENVNENLRTQLISYNNMTLIDSTKNIYIMPVSQLKLDTPEEIPKAEMLYISIPQKPLYYRSGRLFNNIVVLDLKNNINSIIFNQRICIVDYHIFNTNSKNFLFMLVCKKDTNGDKILNQEDLLELLLYDFDNKKVDLLSKKAQHILDLDFINQRNQVVVSIGLDRNDDNIFDRKYEPVILKRIDIESRKIVELLDGKVSDNLQSILDGVINK